MSGYKVLITTSGTGSRLKEFTKDKNKALVKVNDKEVICYVVESYPENVELVVTLGYFGEEVKKFLLNKYPERKFNFVTVDKYEGEGTSLGYSMLQAKEQLQCPFVFHCNDTIILDPIPIPSENWNGGAKGLNSEIYDSHFLSSFKVKDGLMTELLPKGAAEYDYFHIGLVGVKDYGEFWSALESVYNENPKDSSLNDCSAINIMINKGIKFKVLDFPHWLDTGNLASIEFSEKYLKVRNQE